MQAVQERDLVVGWAAEMRARGLLSDLLVRSEDYNQTFRLTAVRREDNHEWCTERTVRIEELMDDGTAAILASLLSIQHDLEVLGPMMFDFRAVVARSIARTLAQDVMEAMLNGTLDNFFGEEDDKAQKRAQRLFADIAGAKAHDDLVAGGKTAVRGSEGTAYHLHQRRTYSVSRDADGATFCAVVTGVPLWDHLLGVKLLVERDEPAFLRVANKSRSSAWRQDEWYLTHGMMNERMSIHRAPLAFDISAVIS